MNRRIIIAIVLAAALLAGGGWWLLGRSAAAAAAKTFSGTIEADEVDLTSEVSGKVVRLLVDEGAPVKAGDTLIALGTDLLDAQLAQARAAEQIAAANLALVRAGAREQDLAQAQAQLDQAAAQRDGARRAWQNAQASTVVTQALVLADGTARSYADAQRNLKNPQELDSQVVQAQAARDAAQAALAQARINEQATRDRLSLAKTQAEAQVQQSAQALTQAQARYAQAKSNWDYVDSTGNDPLVPSVVDTKTGKSKPNKLSDGQRASYAAQLVQADSAMHQAEQAVQQATVAAESARQAEQTGVQAADAQAQAAQTALDNAQRALDHITAVRADPQQLRTAADAALAQLNTARAGVDAARLQRQSAIDAADAQLQSAAAQVTQAQARLELAQAGSRAEQIQSAEAQLAQAKAQVRQLEVQIGKATITAPVDGIVLERVINLGEQAAPGNILLKLGSLAKVKLTIYVPEDQVGPLQLRQGVRVRVQVDSFPDRAFDGTISYIAPQTEFTPRNVQTRQERATTVFPVRIELDNADGALKPGMPADATLP
ncbi:MAG: efflux RND transporter periplasmic adaptor subunit [Kouleothrix sp.]|nr:efflux RND transporter periplasmic adaptor subunit [Kouleothrix sp.]